MTRVPAARLLTATCPPDSAITLMGVRRARPSLTVKTAFPAPLACTALPAPILAAVEGLGMGVVGLIPSPVEGGDGNREFLIGARRESAR